MDYFNKTIQAYTSTLITSKPTVPVTTASRIPTPSKSNKSLLKWKQTDDFKTGSPQPQPGTSKDTSKGAIPKKPPLPKRTTPLLGPLFDFLHVRTGKERSKLQQELLNLPHTSTIKVDDLDFSHMPMPEEHCPPLIMKKESLNLLLKTNVR